MREIPHSLEAEKGLLSCYLLNPDSFGKSLELELKTVDFFSPAHQIIFDAFLKLFETHRPIEMLTLTQLLKDEGNLDKVGGALYLSEILNQEFNTAHVIQYTKIVESKAKLRRLITVTTDILEKAYHGVDNVSDFIDKAEADIYRVSQSTKESNGLTPVRDIVLENFKTLEMLTLSDRSVSGIETGFYDLDRITTGLKPGQLFVIAARPAMGKSVLGLNIAMNAAKLNNKTAAFFSLEMSKEELTFRMMSSASKVEGNKIKTGTLNDQDWTKLTEGANKLSKLPIYIDDRADLGILELRSRCRRLRAEGQLGIIIVDYLQLMRGNKSGFKENRQQEISDISRGLKIMAKELGVPIIALSQLNRSLESRNDKRPMLSDLRESGSIEQDADLVMFIYRDEVYDENTPDKGIAELIVAKQRSGPVGTIRVGWKGHYTTFENLVGVVPVKPSPAPSEFV